MRAQGNSAGRRSWVPAAALHRGLNGVHRTGIPGVESSCGLARKHARGMRKPPRRSGRGCIGRSGRSAVTGSSGSPAYRVSAVPTPFSSGFWHWQHLLNTAKLHRGLARATAQQSGRSTMVRWRRSAGVGVPASGTTYGPQQLAQKKREVVGMLTKPWKRKESRCRGVDDEVWAAGHGGARGGGRSRGASGRLIHQGGLCGPCGGVQGSAWPEDRRRRGIARNRACNTLI